MKLIDNDGNEYEVLSSVVEHNKATGRTRTGWQIFQIIERGGSAAIGIRRPCDHIRDRTVCHEDWCLKSIRKWVAPSSLGLRAVSDVECKTP